MGWCGFWDLGREREMGSDGVSLDLGWGRDWKREEDLGWGREEKRNGEVGLEGKAVDFGSCCCCR